MNRKVWSFVASVVTFVAIMTSGMVSAQVKVDSNLPDYKPTSGVTGSIKSVGSDTMNNLMTLWLEGFKKYYPNVRFEIEGKGSNTAPAALIAGTATFGPMSRPMKADEIDSFEKKFGYKPVGLGTSIDMLAVFIHKDNPLASLSMSQVDSIFSTTRKLGSADDIAKWGQVGLKGEWENAPISLYGRNSASGTYSFFKEHALGKGDYKSSVKEQPGSSSVIQSIATDKFGVGYSGIGYLTADVKAVPLSEKASSKPVAAEAENAYSGEYPLSRSLYIYLNFKQNSKLDPLRREFIKFVFSKEGQQVVVKDGYIPVTAPMAKKALTAVGIQ